MKRQYVLGIILIVVAVLTICAVWYHQNRVAQVNQTPTPEVVAPVVPPADSPKTIVILPEKKVDTDVVAPVVIPPPPPVAEVPKVEEVKPTEVKPVEEAKPVEVKPEVPVIEVK